MHIFLTNDDGFSSKGIRYLALSLSEIAKITVIAPETEMSSCSGSLSLRKPLYLKRQKSYGKNIEVYSLSGTTGDCCKLALEYWLQNDKPDLIISGMNCGFNTGSDCLYSGTVAGAMEGVFWEIPAMAVSTDKSENVDYLLKAADFSKEAVEKYFIKNKYQGVLNLNIPVIRSEKMNWNNVKVTPLGLQQYTNVIKQDKKDEEVMEFYMSGKPVMSENENTDVCWARDGFITVTPLQWNQTDYKQIKDIEKITETFID